MDITMVCNFDEMVARLFFDQKQIKKFNLNKGNPGKSWGFFNYEHPQVGKMKYNIIIELSNNNLELLPNPKLYIYPMMGPGVLSKDPISIETVGTWEAYLKNHKHHYDQ